MAGVDDTFRVLLLIAISVGTPNTSKRQNVATAKTQGLRIERKGSDNFSGPAGSANIVSTSGNALDSECGARDKAKCDSTLRSSGRCSSIGNNSSRGVMGFTSPFLKRMNGEDWDGKLI